MKLGGIVVTGALCIGLAGCITVEVEGGKDKDLRAWAGQVAPADRQVPGLTAHQWHTAVYNSLCILEQRILQAPEEGVCISKKPSDPDPTGPPPPPPPFE